MQVKKTFKGNKEIVQEGSEAPGMAKPKDAQGRMKETKLHCLNQSKYIHARNERGVVK